MSLNVTQSFNQVITKIEESNLNYVIHHRTPFSAQISLKRSFVKYLDAHAQPPVCDELTIKNVEDEPCDIAASELDKVTRALAVANANVDNLENILKKEKAKVISG